jgi:uncharacterized protein
MSRLLLLMTAAAAVYLLLKSFRAPLSKNAAETPAENMVRCEQCGVHLPEKEALKSAGHFYCSEAHLPDKSNA